MPLLERVRVEVYHPDSITSDQKMLEIYVRRSIEAGLADAKAGKTVDVTAVRKKFGLLS